jgi:GWxTD domain-containing protein
VLTLLDARPVLPLDSAADARAVCHSDGRPRGPWEEGGMRRLGLVAIAAATAALGCGGGARGTAPDSPTPAADEAQVPGVTAAAFRRVGRFASGDPLPFVGTLAFVDGPGDTTLAVLALSLENRSLTFEREPSAYAARYRVDIGLQPASGTAVDVGREETVRVATLQETSRTDESVLFQQSFRLVRGKVHVTIAVRDVASGLEGRAEQDYDVPAFAPGSTSDPILAYQAQGRGRPEDPLNIMLNPRGTAGFGGDTVLAYLEGYGFSSPRTLPFEVRNDQDSVVYRDSLRFAGGRPVESQVIRLAPDSLVLGEMRIAVGSGNEARQATALVSFTPAWLVTSYDQIISLLRYHAPNPWLDSLRKAGPADRNRLWREFWRSTDPNPKTPQNEGLDEYFTRVATANAQIKDEGVPGWRTERGEVFITLGPPDEVTEANPGPQSRIIRWTYGAYRLALFFVDESGFGRYRLTSQSRAEYERLKARLRRGES